MVRAITDIDLLQTEMDAREDAEGAPQVLRSASAGAENLIGSLHGAVGAGARAVGLDSIADAADRRADHRLTRSQIVRGDVPSFSEADSIGDYATWATDMLAGNAPLMAATYASGGLLGVGARAVGLGARGAGIAQTAGAAVPYGSTAVAEDYAQLRHDPNAEGTPQEQAQASILSGAVKTALGLGPLGNAKKLLGSGAGIGKTLGVTAAGEGVTEAGEQAISRFTRGQFNEDINLFDAEARAEYIEAALGGALVGTGYSGIGAVARNFLGGQQAGDTAAAKAARAPTFNTDNERLSYMQEIRNVLNTEQASDNLVRDGAWRELTRVGNQMGEAKYSDMARQIIDGVRTAGLMPAEAAAAGTDIDSRDESLDDRAEFSDIVDSDPVDFTGLTDVEVGQSDYQGGPGGRPYVVATGGVTDAELNKMRQFDPDSDYQVMSMASAAAEQWRADPTTVRRGKLEGEEDGVKKFSPGGDEVLTGRGEHLAQEANKLWQSYGDKAREKLGRFVEADRKAYNDEIAANEARRTDLMNQLEGTEFGSAEADAVVAQLETADARVTPPAERFLSRFSVVRRTPKSIDAMPERGNISFTLEELMSERNNKGGRAPVISARAKPRNAEKGVVREIPIDTANGPMTVDAVNLTNMMMKKLRGSQVGGGGSTREKAAMAFATGMSSILENPSVRGGFSRLNDNTVIWRPAGKGKPLTVKDARSVRDANHGLFNQIQRAEAELNVLRETWRNNPEARARTEELAKEQQAIINSAASKIDSKTDLSPKKYRDTVDELAAAEEEMAELQRIAGENDTRESNDRRIGEIQAELANPHAESDIAQLQADLTGLDNAQYGLGQAEPLNRKRFGELQGEIANLRQLARRNDERVEGFAQPVRDIQGENEVDSGIVQPTEMKPRFNPDQGRTQGGENESLVNDFERRVGYYDDATTRPAKEGPKLYGNPAQGEKADPKIGDTPVSNIPPKQGKRGQDFVNSLSETMGINAPKSVESDEMVARLRAAGETVMAQDLEAGNLRGVSLREGGDVVWVNPHLSDAQYVEVMAHELGHKVMQDAFMNADMEVKVEVIDEFKAWHEDSKGRSTADVMRSRSGVTEATAEGFDREYAMDFEEWFADNVMRWATTAATPRTVVEKFFAGVAKVLKKAIREFNKVLRKKGLPEYGPADSIHDFMEAQAKSAKGKQFTHADVSMAQDYAQVLPDAEAQAGAETAAESGGTEQERAEEFSESVEQGAGSTPDPAKDAANVDRVRKYVKEFSKLVGIRAPRVVSTQSFIDSIHGANVERTVGDIRDGHVLGAAATTANGEKVLWISPDLTDMQFVEAITHELGHIVADTTFAEADAATREAVMADFHKWLKDVEGRDLTDVVRSRAGPALNDRGAYSKEYAENFDEWFADNVMRWATTSAKPQTLTEKFFAGMAEKFEKALAQLRKVLASNNLPPYKPAASLASFMDAEVERAGSSWFDSISDKIKAGAARTKESLFGEQADGAPDPAEQFSESVEQGAGGFMGSLRSWATALQGGRRAVLSSRMIQAINQHIGLHMSETEYEVLRKAADGGYAQRAMRNALRTSPRALKDISESSDLATAYLFALVSTGTINAGPRTSNVVNKFSEKVDQIYKGVFGDMSSAAQERALFEAIERGQLSGGEGSAIAMPENVYKAQAQAAARQLRDTLTKFKDNTYEALMGSPYARLVDSDSQPLRDLARLISTSSYDSAGRGEGYIGRRNAQFTNYANQVARALGPAVNDEALRQQVWRVMHGVDPMGGASREVQQAVRKLRGAMNRMLEYGRGAGIDIPKRQNYFPWVWNKEALSSRREEITEYMNRDEFAPHWDALMEKSLRENATTSADGGVEVTQVTREEFIQKRIDDLLGSEGVGHGLQNESNSPGFRFMNARDLNFLESQTDAAGRAELSSFFEQDLNTTMLRYVSSLVKRAEATRQFGEKGQKVDELLARAKAEGAPDNLIEVGRGFVNAALGMHGTKTRDFLDNIAATQPLPEVVKKMLRKPDVGVMNENTKKMYGWLITYENYRLLALSVFSSFVDPLATGVRASSLPILGKAMNEARRSMWQATKGNTDELMSMAEALGTIDRAMVSEELTAEYTGHQFEGKAKGLNDALFKWNGVESVTKFSRLVATAGADAFIRKHTNSDTEQSTAYLDELGISKDDVREVNGRLKFMTEEEYNGASRSERDRDDRMKQAVRRFVDSANVRPDPAKRPLYLSDPHFALVGHLKMFAFAFHETVIKRVAAEAKNGEFTPAVLLAGTFVPMMLMADMLRDMIKYGEPEAPYKEGWTLVEHIDNAIKRAGLYGRDEITADIMDPLFKGNFTQAATEALGPTATHIRKTSEWGPGVQDLPLQNLYKNWI